MKYIISILIALTISSCATTQYSQLFETSSTLRKDEKNFYVYENDSIRVKYYFWYYEGIMAFSIYNKLDKPIYVDWKKSSFVKDQVKYDYWVDEEIHRSAIYAALLTGKSPIWDNTNVSFGAAESYSRKTKPERITFIAPRSYVFRSTFVLFKNHPLALPEACPTVELKSSNKYNKTGVFNAYLATFKKEHSPLVFRNFLSFSTSEKFDTEFYIDNEFYVSSILEMPSQEVMGYIPTGETQSPFPFLSPIKFYLNIDRNTAIEVRKKYK